MTSSLAPHTPPASVAVRSWARTTVVASLAGLAGSAAAARAQAAGRRAQDQAEQVGRGAVALHLGADHASPSAVVSRHPGRPRD